MTLDGVFPSAVAELESHRAQLVCLYLAIRGEATMAEVKRDLNVPFLTLYSLLPALRDAGLVVQNGDRWRFQAEPVAATV